jgi:hypothetical protein
MPRGGRRDTDVRGRYPPVLVIDRDETARRACAGYLVWFAFEAIEAAGSDEAASLVQATQPHAILAEVAVALKLPLATHLSIPLIVTMTQGETDRPPNAAGLLVKPLKLPEMLEEVRRVLRARAAN